MFQVTTYIVCSFCLGSMIHNPLPFQHSPRRSMSICFFAPPCLQIIWYYNSRNQETVGVSIRTFLSLIIFDQIWSHQKYSTVLIQEFKNNKFEAFQLPRGGVLGATGATGVGLGWSGEKSFLWTREKWAQVRQGLLRISSCDGYIDK